MESNWRWNLYVQMVRNYSYRLCARKLPFVGRYIVKFMPPDPRGAEVSFGSHPDGRLFIATHALFTGQFPYGQTVEPD